MPAVGVSLAQFLRLKGHNMLAFKGRPEEQSVIDEYRVIRNQQYFKEIDYSTLSKLLCAQTYTSLLICDQILMNVILNDDVDMLESIAGNLDRAHLMRLFQAALKDDNRTAMHLVASPSRTTGKRCLSWIKSKIFTSEDHSDWIRLISALQGEKDTPVHYAARRTDIEELELFLSGLTVDEIVAQMRATNQDGSNVLDVFFINYETPIQAAQVANRLKALMPEHWVELLTAQSNSTKGNKKTVIGQLQLFKASHNALFTQIILDLTDPELEQFKVLTQGVYNQLIDRITLVNPAPALLLAQTSEPARPLTQAFADILAERKRQPR